MVAHVIARVGAAAREDRTGIEEHVREYRGVGGIFSFRRRNGASPSTTW